MERLISIIQLVFSGLILILTTVGLVHSLIYNSGNIIMYTIFFVTWVILFIYSIKDYKDSLK